MNKTVLSVILIVIALGAGFFGGMQYQKSQQPSGGMYVSNGGGMRRFGGQNGQNFRPVRGQVLSLDTNNMTVKLPNGNSEIVILSGSTQYMKSASAAATDVKTGDTVMVVGTQNSDGSVTASDVQINPAGMQRVQRGQ